MMTFIHCPDCDAVRETASAGCPECGRCANCGEKPAEGARNCECGFPEDEKIVGRIVRQYLIPDDEVEREIFKREKWKTLQPYLLAAKILLLGICVSLGFITAVFMMAESNELVKIVLGLPVGCLCVLFYWGAFRGVGRIMLWAARKVGIWN
jgi:hypothetical protein